MRTAKKFRPRKNSKKVSPEKSSSIFTRFLPRTSSTSNIFSCLCCQIQCRRHTRLRMTMGSTKQSLMKYYEENQNLERQKAILVKSSICEESSSALTITAAAAEAAARTSQILNKQHRTRRTRDIHLSAMLIGLNVFYLILNLPFNLYQTFAKHIYSPNSDPCDIMFIGVLLDALQQTFFSTNFFLYVLTNRRFREEFYNTFSRFFGQRKEENVRYRPPTSSNATTTNNRSRARISSCNPSTIVLQPTQTGEPAPVSRTSIASEMELSENPSADHQRGTTAKFVVFKDLSERKT
uniref:G-protein coupled receptors family 1 profile domain-containing protein n=1 Tax=Philodina roseola TaxID=96448 RepID=B2ZFC6_PHIRO|nr:hypothetical protein 22 [Philodina roseola]